MSVLFNYSSHQLASRTAIGRYPLGTAKHIPELSLGNSSYRSSGKSAFVTHDRHSISPVWRFGAKGEAVLVLPLATHSRTLHSRREQSDRNAPGKQPSPSALVVFFLVLLLHTLHAPVLSCKVNSFLPKQKGVLSSGDSLVQ